MQQAAPKEPAAPESPSPPPLHHCDLLLGIALLLVHLPADVHATLPEAGPEQWTQHWSGDREQCYHRLPIAPEVDVENAGRAGKCQGGSDDGGRDDKQAAAQQQCDANTLP